MCAFSAAGIAGAHFVFSPARVAAAEPAARAVSETAPSLADRDRLYERAEGLAAAGHVPEALEAARKMLAMEVQILGANHEDVGGSYEMIAGLLERLDRFPEATEARTKQLNILIALHGGDNWRVSDARRAIAFSQQRSKLTIDDRRHLAAADEKEALIGELSDQGKYADAIDPARQCLAIRREILGEEHPLVAESLNIVGFVLIGIGDYAAARPYYEQSLAIRKKVLGEEHPETANSLNNLGFLLQATGDFTAARSRYDKALAIRKKVLGEEHPETVTSLNNLGGLLEATGDYAAARSYYEQCLTIRKKVYGEEHPATASSLNNLGFVLTKMGDYAAALPYYEQALAIRKKTLGEEHPDTASSLNNLGYVLQSMGDYAAARPCYDQALAIRKKVQGEEHPDTATTLNNLGALLESTGDYAAARAFYERSLAIRKKALGEAHVDTAESMNNLGLLLAEIGDYAGARAYYEQALTLRRKILGDDHSDTASSLNNFAMLLESTGDSSGARSYYEQALAINKRVLGEEHPDTATSLNNLGLLLHDTGHSAAARPYLEQALAIRKKILGDAHPDTAISLSSLGSLSMSLGDYPGAKRYCEEAVAVHMKAQGSDHLVTAKAIANLAVVSAVQGDWPAAIDGFVEANRIQQRSLENVFSTATEARMRAYLETMSRGDDDVLSLPLAQFNREADGLTWVLRRKSIVFEAQCRFRAAQWLAREDPEFAQRQSALLAAQRQLDDATLRPPADVAPEELAKRRKPLESKIAELEDQLQATLATRLGSEGSLMTTIDSVRSQLPLDAALVEIVKYVPLNFQATGGEDPSGPERYVAFVLHADEAQPVDLVELGEAAPIDEAVASLGQHQQDVRRGGEEADWPELEASYRGLAAPLCEKLFAPIAAELAGVKHVYLSPDSQLHNLPFEALVDANGKYLAEEGYTFAYLTSGRDLLRGKADQPGEGAFVFAAPNYDLKHGERFRLAQDRGTQSRDSQGAPPELVASAGPLGARSADVRGLKWKVLPAMASEGAEAAERLANGPYGSVQSYNGDDALEERFKSMVHPRLVVLVTHGFYLPDQPVGREKPFGADAVTRGAFAQGKGIARLRAQENPLYRSGVVLAGANTLDDPVPNGESVEDGWLTAEEISQLDLRGTDLVVLSACNTGRGQVATGEAVAGLRSAFLFAGARTLVGSLYEVPDRETRELMKTFYAGLRQRHGKLDSLNDARLELIEKLRAEHGAAHPFFWGSFVLVGEP